MTRRLLRGQHRPCSPTSRSLVMTDIEAMPMDYNTLIGDMGAAPLQ
ncbi:MAG: hypothetical protein IH627_17580 [Rubrivivax sp.]|nr:hypothetical protein [Rubrivivax sp.]